MRVEVAFGGNRPLHAMFKAESHGVDISVRAKVGSWFPAYCALSVRRVTRISVRRRGGAMVRQQHQQQGKRAGQDQNENEGQGEDSRSGPQMEMLEMQEVCGCRCEGDADR
jgi:hypothetical protein